MYSALDDCTAQLLELHNQSTVGHQSSEEKEKKNDLSRRFKYRYIIDSYKFVGIW